MEMKLAFWKRGEDAVYRPEAKINPQLIKQITEMKEYHNAEKFGQHHAEGGNKHRKK